MNKLPYRVETGTGDIFDIEFPLHAETSDPVRVNQIISRLLASIDRDLALFVDTSNGDVLQAVSMVLAVRAGMVHADTNTTHRLALELLTTALSAVASAPRQVPQTGHA
jgi:hypothetical protein